MAQHACCHCYLIFLLLSGFVSHACSGISTSLGNETFRLSDLSQSFHPYSHGGTYTTQSAIPAWIVTDSDASTIHRFFDSSPFSPSGRYLALLRIPKAEKVRDIEREMAEIVVYDLRLGPSSMKVIARTSAWDTQVSCRLQSHLLVSIKPYYNVCTFNHRVAAACIVCDTCWLVLIEQYPSYCTHRYPSMHTAHRSDVTYSGGLLTTLCSTMCE